MALDFNIFDIDWAKKGHGHTSAYGYDVYISVSNHGHRDSVYIGFRNNKLPITVKYIQMAKFGDLLLFKEAPNGVGWKVSDGNTLTSSRNIHPSLSVIPEDILELIKAHNHEGFDLHYDAKSKIYYIDTTKAVGDYV